MPNGQPAQLANLKPWKRGNSAPRRSRDVDKALHLARKYTAEAVLFAARVMRDETQDMRYRLKAADMILDAGLPQNPDVIDQILGEMSGASERVFRIEFVDPQDSLPVVVENEPARLQTNGHDPEPFEPVFVDP